MYCNGSTLILITPPAAPHRQLLKGVAGGRAVCAVSHQPKKCPQSVPVYWGCLAAPPRVTAAARNCTHLWVLLLNSKKHGKEEYFGISMCVFMLSKPNTQFVFSCIFVPASCSVGSRGFCLWVGKSYRKDLLQQECRGESGSQKGDVG